MYVKKNISGIALQWFNKLLRIEVTLTNYCEKKVVINIVVLELYNALRIFKDNYIRLRVVGMVLGRFSKR